MSAERPISEEDLQAYVDDRLEIARQAEVSAYLELHPDLRRRVETYRAQRTALRAALQPAAEEPIPGALNLHRIVEDQKRGRPAIGWRNLAAGLALLAIGATGGWSLRSAETGGVGVLAREAADSFRVYGSDHIHPVELRADDSAELAGWVTASLGRAVQIPDLAQAGYRFMGGRIVPTAHGAAAMFMYDNDHGIRLAMLVRPMVSEQDASMSEHALGDIKGYAWAEKGLGYSLVGDVAPEQIHPLADEIRRQERLKS